MSRNNSIKIFISLLVLIAAACSLFSTPAVIAPAGTGDQQAPTPTWTHTQQAPTPTSTQTQQAPTPTSTVPQNSICGWIENGSTTGVMAPIMTVSGTGQVLQLWNLDSDAISKFNYISPAYFRVYDPAYQAPDLLVNFSSIEQVSSCPLTQTVTNNPTQVAYVSGFAGTWDTNWGDMTCSVDGQMVICNYTHDIGIIEAGLSLDGITMEGSWSESPSYQPPDDGGKVIFTLSEDGNSIAGHWWYGQIDDGGSWTGTRK